MNGHTDPRDHKVTWDVMTPIARIEGNTGRKRYDGREREEIDQLIEYEWPGE